MSKVKDKNLLIVIAGPTASGKTSLSINLAKIFNAEIISADSRQVYKEMSIGTAKPSLEEMDGIVHHFINIVSIHDNYSVGHFEKEVISFLDNYYKKNDVAILCGGTGLYINSILYGLDEFPHIEAEVKKAIIDEYERKGLGFLQKELETKDFAYYQTVDLNNPHRLIRALSVIKQSGKPYSYFLKKNELVRNFDTKLVFLDIPRNELYNRINNRVDIMMENGLEDEAKLLYDFRELKSLQTVGYSELFDYFSGEISKEEAIELIKRNTRRYAKRQMTWFRNKGDFKAFSPNDIENIIDFIS